jgi:hypothetical protein
MHYRMASVLVVAAAFLVGIFFPTHVITAAPDSKGSPYLFIWSGDASHKTSDFLAVLDAQTSSPTYGHIIASLPIGLAGTMPHHTEYEFPEGDVLFANGWTGNRTFLFDLRHPLQPRLMAQFTERDGYTFAHSFARLPGGHVLATFQSHGEGYAPGGGLVELDDSGTLVRSASALDPAVGKDVIWPYSLTIVPQSDRVVSTSTTMGWPDWATLPQGSWSLQKINDQHTRHLQVWRLSDLRLLKTVTLAPDSNGEHNLDPAEPRLLPGGSVLVSTFSCGLYRVKDLDRTQPSADLVYSFPGGADMHTMCSVPVVVGHYWIQTVGAVPGLIALDVSHPEKPVEVSRLKLDPRFAMPHWLAADRKSNRLVITGDGQSWVLVAHFDPQSGVLSLDDSFREAGANQPGISFVRQEWPHGKSGPAVVHGALFGPN